MHKCFAVSLNGKVAIDFEDETTVVALAVNRTYFVFSLSAQKRRKYGGVWEVEPAANIISIHFPSLILPGVKSL